MREKVVLKQNANFEEVLKALSKSPSGEVAIVDFEGKLLGKVSFDGILPLLTPDYTNLLSKEFLFAFPVELDFEELAFIIADDLLEEEVCKVNKNEIKLEDLLVRMRTVKTIFIVDDEGKFVDYIFLNDLIAMMYEKWKESVGKDGI